MSDSNPQLWLHLTLLQLLEENRTDSLTGILNRRGFEEALIQLTATAQRYQRPLSLILIDMCCLKRLNQQQGHVAGDQALKTLVERIQLNKRDADIIARVGGDEFALLLPETCAQEGSVQFSEFNRICTDITLRFHTASLKHPAKISMPKPINSLINRSA